MYTYFGRKTSKCGILPCIHLKSTHYFIKYIYIPRNINIFCTIKMCTKHKKLQLPCCSQIHHEIAIRDTRGPSQFFSCLALLGHVVGPCMGLARRQASLVAGTHPDLSLNCRQPARLRCSQKAELTLQCTRRGLAKQQMPPERPCKEGMFTY